MIHMFLLVANKMAEPFAETGGTGKQGGRECSFGGGDSRPITNSFKETSCTHYVAYEPSFSFPFLQFPPLPPTLLPMQYG